MAFLLYYAVVYAGNAIIGTFLPVYFHEEGFTEEQVGLLLSLAPFISLLGQPIWGAAGDRAAAKRNVLGVLLVGSGLAILLVPLASPYFGLVFVGIGVFSFFQTSIFSLSDAITLEELDRRKSWSFGTVRMGGTIGYAVMSVAFGFAAQAHIGSLFPVYACIMAAAALLLFRFPAGSGNSPLVRKTSYSVLLRNKKLMTYLSVSFAIQLSLGFYYSFFPIYLLETGGTHSLLGWSMLISSISEIPFLLLSGRLLARFKIPYFLIAAGLASVIRWFLFSQLTDPYWMLPVQLLHGVIFIVLSVSIATYINREVPPEWKASGQALNGLINLGAARIAGSLLGGAGAAVFGIRNMFLYCSALTLLCVAAFAAMVYMEHVKSGKESSPKA